jgi:sulfofructose kinase
MDTIALVNKYPNSDERVEAREIKRSVGGPAAVASITLARLGIRSAIIGTIGSDNDGDEILSIFENEGVDFSGVTRSSEATSGSVIVVSKSENSRAISTRQAISQNSPSATAKSIVRNSKWVHVDHVGITKLEQLEIKRGGTSKISFDAGYGVKDFDASKVDLFVPNSVQMKERYPDLTLEQAVEADGMKCKNTVVSTYGSKGAIGFNAAEGLVSSKPWSGEIVSTLGAGDVFHGAILAALHKGYSLGQSMNYANLVAGLSCRGLDGTSAIPTEIELNQYLGEF